MHSFQLKPLFKLDPKLKVVTRQGTQLQLRILTQLQLRTRTLILTQAVAVAAPQRWHLKSMWRNKLGKPRPEWDLSTKKDSESNLRSEGASSSPEEEHMLTGEELQEEQKLRPWKSDAPEDTVKWNKVDALPWTEDTDSANSARKAEEDKSAELSDLADVVKQEIDMRESSAGESTEDGEFPGWDTRKKDVLFEDNKDGELPEEFEEKRDEEWLLEKESKEEDGGWDKE